MTDLDHSTLTDLTKLLRRSPWRVFMPGVSVLLDRAAHEAEHVASLQSAAIRHWRNIAERNRREAELFRQMAADNEIDAIEAREAFRARQTALEAALASGAVVKLPQDRRRAPAQDRLYGHPL